MTQVGEEGGASTNGSGPIGSRPKIYDSVYVVGEEDGFR